MRSHEFIAEAITIADYQEQFEKATKQIILDSLKKILTSESKYRPFDEHFRSIEPLTDRYLDRFLFNFTLSCRFKFSDMLESFVAQRYKDDEEFVRNYKIVGSKISFNPDIKSYGYANKLSIVINYSFLKSIVSAIKKYIYDYFYNVDKSEKKSIKDIFLKALQKIINDPHTFFKTHSSLKNIITQFVETITHELVHVFQQAEQFRKKRPNFEYRSYAEKDLEKFRTAMRNKSSIEDFRIYHASPQEITAFAHNIASQILKNTEFKSIILWPDTDQSNYNKIISDYVAKHLRYTPEQRKNMNYIERKVFNRYVKQVYQILQHYIETEREKFYSLYDKYVGF